VDEGLADLVSYLNHRALIFTE